MSNSTEETAQQNAFERFGLPVSFAIDLNALEAAYFAYQQRFHPDRLVGKSDAERLDAMQKTMDINAEYECLKEPLSRAEYLLSLNNMIVNKDGEGIKPSQTLLMESLESREALDQASGDTLIAMKQHTKNAVENCCQQLTSLFEKKQLDEAAQATIRLRYLQKLEQEIQRKIQKEHSLKNK